MAAALEGTRGTWNAANLVSAVGVVVAAVGLSLLGRNLRRGRQLRTRRAARIVTLLGVATAIEAVLRVWNATTSTDSLAATYGDPTGSALLITLGLAWTLAALGVFIGLGLA